MYKRQEEEEEVVVVVVVRAWREGKTRFARQRLVSRQEVPAEDIRCQCRRLCSFRSLYGANFAPIDDGGEQEEKRSFIKRKEKEKCVIVVRCFYGMA